MVYYREGCSFPPATGSGQVSHMKLSLSPGCITVLDSVGQDTWSTARQGRSPYLTAHYPDLSSPAPPRGQTNALASSSSRGQNWYHGTQRPTTCQLVRLSSGQSPRQTRTFLSARIFSGPRDHILAAKSKEKGDSSKVLEWRIFCSNPNSLFPFSTHSGSDGIGLPLRCLYHISLLSQRSLKLTFAFLFHDWISTWSTNNIQMRV